MVQSSGAVGGMNQFRPPTSQISPNPNNLRPNLPGQLQQSDPLQNRCLPRMEQMTRYSSIPNQRPVGMQPNLIMPPQIQQPSQQSQQPQSQAPTGTPGMLCVRNGS